MLHAVAWSRTEIELPRQGWAARLRANILQLSRVGKAGNVLPAVGLCCLILKGVEQQDVGQEAVVTKRTKAMVRVTYLERDGRQASKMKHPGSLVLLEDGLHVTQDHNGFVWIKRDVDETR
jgi:hypothetical protein